MTRNEQNAIARNVGFQLGLAYKLMDRAEAIEPTFTSMAVAYRAEARDRIHYAQEAQAQLRMFERHGR